MTQQLRRTLADLRWQILWYGAGLFAYVLLIAAFWPTMRANTRLFDQYLAVFPEGLRTAFGITDMSTFAGFLGVEIFNLMWPLVASVFVVMAATATVALEIDRGTAEFWLSVPTERWRLLAGKLMAVLAGIVALDVVSAAAIVVGARFTDERIAASDVLAAAAVLLSFEVAIAGYSALLSSLSSERGRAAGIAAAITLASYVASVVAGLSADWKRLESVSLMTAYHPQAALETGVVHADQVGVLLAVGVVCALASLVVFQRRDAI